MSQCEVISKGKIPDGMVLIGYWNTASGKHPQLLVCKKNAGATAIKEAIRDNSRFMDELAFLEVCGEDLIIHTPQSRRGLWIGNNGWRIKGLQLALGKGKVEFKDLFSINDGKWTIVKTSVGFLTTYNFGPGAELCCKLCDLMEPYKVGHTEIGVGDQRVGETSYKTEVEGAIEEFVTDNKSQITKALIQEKIEAWFFNPLYTWEGTIKGDWEYTAQYRSKDKRMKLENLRYILQAMTEIKKRLIKEKEKTEQSFSFDSPPLLDMLVYLVSEMATEIPETIEKLNRQLVNLAIDIKKTLQDCRECYDSKNRKYIKVPKLVEKK